MSDDSGEQSRKTEKVKKQLYTESQLMPPKVTRGFFYAKCRRVFRGKRKNYEMGRNRFRRVWMCIDGENYQIRFYTPEMVLQGTVDLRMLEGTGGIQKVETKDGSLHEFTIYLSKFDQEFRFAAEDVARRDEAFEEVLRIVENYPPVNERLREEFLEADADHSHTLDMGEIDQLLRKRGVFFSKKTVQKKFNEVDLDSDGTLAFCEYEKLDRMLRREECVEKLFEDCLSASGGNADGTSSGNELRYMNDSMLRTFLTTHQGEGRTELRTCRAIIKRHSAAPPGTTTAKTTITPVTGKKKGESPSECMDVWTFTDYITSPVENPPYFVSHATRVYDFPDDDDDLRNFFIRSARFLYSVNSTEGNDRITAAVMQGYRYLELDLCKGARDGVSVLLGGEKQKVVSLDTVLKHLVKAVFDPAMGFDRLPFFLQINSQCVTQGVDKAIAEIKEAFKDHRLIHTPAQESFKFGEVAGKLILITENSSMYQTGATYRQNFVADEVLTESKVGGNLFASVAKKMTVMRQDAATSELASSTISVDEPQEEEETYLVERSGGQDDINGKKKYFDKISVVGRTREELSAGNLLKLPFPGVIEGGTEKRKHLMLGKMTETERAQKTCMMVMSTDQLLALVPRANLTGEMKRKDVKEREKRITFFTDLCKRNFVRVFPASSNAEPFLKKINMRPDQDARDIGQKDTRPPALPAEGTIAPWGLGAQIFGQLIRERTITNSAARAFFLDNGGCGFIRKPEWMTKGDGLPPKNHGVVLNVTVHSARALPEINERDVADPYIRVSIKGWPDDEKSFKTCRIMNNGWDPCWNETFSFELSAPELDVVVFEVWDWDQTSEDDFVADTAVAVRMLKKGIRSLRLENDDYPDICSHVLASFSFSSRKASKEDREEKEDKKADDSDDEDSRRRNDDDADEADEIVLDQPSKYSMRKSGSSSSLMTQNKGAIVHQRNVSMYAAPRSPSPVVSGDEGGLRALDAFKSAGASIVLGRKKSLAERDLTPPVEAPPPNPEGDAN